MPIKKGTSKPQVWISGPDPMRHSKYTPWLRARNQAIFRGEEYLLTFDEFCELWTDELWVQRGRASESLSMTRLDHDGAWSIANCVIVSRSQQIREANILRHQRRRERERNNG